MKREAPVPAKKRCRPRGVGRHRKNEYKETLKINRKLSCVIFKNVHQFLAGEEDAALNGADL